MSTLKQNQQTTLTCDVLVIGAGVSGYCAAIQASRSGCDTLLIDKDDVLGGNSGPHLGVGITGANRFANYASETGIIHELQEEAAWIDAYGLHCNGAYTISRRHEAVVQSALEKAGVRIMKRCLAREPVMEGQRIVAVIAEDMAAFRTVRIEVRQVVIECSGDGELGARAGAEFDMGGEARSEFSERSAPEKRSKLVQGSSLVGIAWNAGRVVSFTPPPGTPAFMPRLWEGSVHDCLHHEHYCGVFRENKPGALQFLYMTEKGGDRDTIRDDAVIYEDLMKSFWAEWHHIKNGPHANDARQWDILWISPKAGKRESRRLMGDYVLTQTDLEQGRCFEDDIAFGGHDLDEHRVLPSGHAEIHGHSIPPVYGIPFRSCYSRNVDNLLIGGRLISATHLAHSAIRVMRTGGAIGQAIGLAAALCCKHKCLPREVSQKRFQELRDELLHADATLLNVALPAAGDLARIAQVTASSECRWNDVEPGDLVPVLNQLGNVIYDWQARLEAVEVWLCNLSDTDEPLRLRVLRTKREPRWRPTDSWCKTERARFVPAQFRPLAETTARVPAKFQGWFRITLPQPLALEPKDAASDDDLLMIALDANPIVEWAAARKPSELVEWWEFHQEAAEWKPLRASGAMRVFPEPMLGEAKNVINGFSRRFSTAPTNMWQTLDHSALPQEIVLSWTKPQTVSRVVCHFDNLARLERENPWEHGPRALPCLVKSYVLEAEVAGQWQEIAREDTNFHRWRTHTFPSVTTKQLRLRILSMHGEGQGVRVYEISVYAK